MHKIWLFCNYLLHLQFMWAPFMPHKHLYNISMEEAPAFWVTEWVERVGVVGRGKAL